MLEAHPFLVSPFFIWLVLVGLVLASAGRPVAAQGIAAGTIPFRVVDDSKATRTGNWSTSSRVPPFVGDHYLHTIDGTITFPLEVPAKGVYHLFASYSPHPNRTTKATYRLSREGMESSGWELNQQSVPSHAAGFAPLGEVELSAGVYTLTVKSAADGVLVADAVAVLSEVEREAFIAFQPATATAETPESPKVDAAPQFVKQFPPNALQTLTPAQLDQMLTERLGPVSDSDLLDDEAYLRRVTLDIIGRVPRVDEVAAFEADASADRRQRVVERLLASPEYGRNWGRYWGDVIGYRVPNPQLTFLNYDPFETWLGKQFNEDRGWDEITFDILTARGKVGDNPAATFVGFHQADTSRLASESTRVFLAVNIQCAECHDHKFIDMPQRTFHEFAAYFARADADLPWNDSNQIEVKSKGKGEYRMPGSKQLMQPVAFGRQQLDLGLGDLERRVRLARWITNPTNPWFARAYVNRVWARLMGRGFCEPVDEIGELANPFLPEVHQAVGDHFAASGFDSKALVRLITATRMYQRVAGEDDEQPFATAWAQRLRADEVFESLRSAVELPNYTPPASDPTDAIRFPPPPKSTRDLVDLAYGFDPSLAREQVVRTMRQAMFMMNNQQIQRQIDGSKDSNTVLARLLSEEPDDRRLVERLFLRTVARKPTSREASVALEHIQSVGDRTAGFEDLLWSLLNSAEFTTRN